MEDKHEQDQFEGLIQGLIDNNYGYCDDFIPVNTVIGLLSNIQRLSDTGLMNLSGIGNKQHFQHNNKVRGDIISWINESSEDQFEMVYLKKIQQFISYLNKTCYTAISTYESHYASYEQKSVYKRHLDQFKSDQGRKFSIVLYLNQDWKAEDGGMLSLYPVDKAQVDISPLGGRIVFFRSDEMEHEVHASFTRTRNSIAGWLKN